MLTFKQLHTEEEFNIYSQSYQECLGEGPISKTKGMPFDYFQRSYVIGVFDNEKMVAGYTLGFDVPLRLPTFVPREENILSPHEIFKWEECCEIVCMWKKKEQVSKFFVFRYFWPHILSKTLESNKLFILGHDQNARLDKHYGIFGPVSLYSGPSTIGLPSHLFFYTRGKVRLLKYFSLLRSFFHKDFKSR